MGGINSGATRWVSVKINRTPLANFGRVGGNGSCRSGVYRYRNIVGCRAALAVGNGVGKRKTSGGRSRKNRIYDICS